MTDVSAMYAKDWITIAALILGPIMAVGVTLWYQKREAKRAAKERLFVTLMAHRKSNPPNPEWVNGLNLIDVVFGDHPKVRERWQVVYTILETTPWNEQRYTHAYLELMSEIATVLGYRDLTQTAIDKFYSPEAIGKQNARVYEAQTELLRVLKASKNFGSPKDSEADEPEF